MIIINTPHNPVGKVFTREELEGIAAIAEEFNLLVMSDEVVRSHVFHQLDVYLAKFSTKPWFSMVKSMYALLLCQECLIVL